MAVKQQAVFSSFTSRLTCNKNQTIYMQNYLKKHLSLWVLFVIAFYACDGKKTTSASDNQPKAPVNSLTDTPSKTPQKPNIIIMLADDLGWNDVGYHGSKIRTPHIDKLTKQGIELDRFYAYFSCTPSRVGLLTGRYPGRTGLSGKVIVPNRKDGLPPEEILLPEILAEEGYTKRACIGKWHLGHSNIKFHPLNQGFTYFYGHYGGQVNYFTHRRRQELDWHRNYETCYDKGYATTLLTNEAVKFINESSDDAPFFLYLPFNAPHTPLQAEEKYLKLYGYDPNEPPFSETDPSAKMDTMPDIKLGQGNTKRQTYSAMVTAMDAGIGQILQALEDKNIADNTLIMFMSDNGAYPKSGGSNRPLRGHKGQPLEGGVRLPACIRWNEGLPQNAKMEKFFTYVDVLPTILDMVGRKDIAHQIDGKSVYADLKTPSTKAKKSDEFEYISKNSIRQGRWKLVNGELFDIQIDPYEATNLKKRKKQIYNRLKKQLKIAKAEIETNKKADLSFEIQKEWKMPSD